MLLDRVGERTGEPGQHTGKTGGAAGTCLNPASTQFRHRGEGRGILDCKAAAHPGTENGERCQRHGTALQHGHRCVPVRADSFRLTGRQRCEDAGRVFGLSDDDLYWTGCTDPPGPIRGRRRQAADTSLNAHGVNPVLTGSRQLLLRLDERRAVSLMSSKPDFPDAPRAASTAAS
jgi:hypothetical protein